MLASVPVLFSLQQAIEGFIWLNPNNTLLPYAYLFFAFAIWPTWIPLCFFVFPPPRATKKIIQWLVYAGIMLSCLLAYLLYVYGAHAHIIGNHIHYVEAYPKSYITELAIDSWYLAVTVLPFFLMHNIYIACMGGLVLTSCMITVLAWHFHFASLWCFYAALISSCVPIILIKKHNTRA